MLAIRIIFDRSTWNRRKGAACASVDTSLIFTSETIKILESDVDAKSKELTTLNFVLGEEIANLKEENDKLKAKVAQQIAEHYGVAQTEILKHQKEIAERQSEMVKYQNKIKRHQDEMINLRGSAANKPDTPGGEAAVAPAEGVEEAAAADTSPEGGGDAANVEESAAPTGEKKEEGGDGAPPSESAEPPARR